MNLSRLSSQLLTLTAIAICAMSASASLAQASHACDPKAYGVSSDGKTSNTKALQAAIDGCSRAGGGVIHLTAGTYLSGPLALKSHVHLDLDEDATLLGSTNFDEYPVRPDAPWRRIALIHADDQTDIGITGKGTIDGNGQPWWDKAHTTHLAGDTLGSAGFARPLLFDLVRSKHILIQGVHIRNSPMYNITLFLCDDITIRDISIKNPATGAPNTDGIDPFSSSHIIIDHVTIDTGDDCIAIKSGLLERGEPVIPSSDITITNSTLLHGHGLSIGSETAGGVHNVTVDHVTFKGTDAGIRIKSNRTRGNDMGNYKYSNITMEDVKVPILITEYYPRIPTTDTAQPMAEHTPRFHDIVITNVTATGARDAGVIMGLPESPIKGLVLTNVRISAAKGMTVQNADVVMKDVTVKAEAGEAIQIGDHAHITKTN